MQIRALLFSSNATMDHLADPTLGITACMVIHCSLVKGVSVVSSAAPGLRANVSPCHGSFYHGFVSLHFLLCLL